MLSLLLSRAILRAIARVMMIKMMLRYAAMPIYMPRAIDAADSYDLIRLCLMPQLLLLLIFALTPDIYAVYIIYHYDIITADICARRAITR